MQSPFNRGGFSRSSDTSIGKAPGVGYFTGTGIGSRSGKGYGARSEGVVAESLERSYPWTIGFFFGNTELSMELWNIISGILGFGD